MNFLPLMPLYYEIIDAREGYVEVSKHLLYGEKMRFMVSVDAYGNVVPEMLD